MPRSSVEVQATAGDECIQTVGVGIEHIAEEQGALGHVSTRRAFGLGAQRPDLGGRELRSAHEVVEVRSEPTYADPVLASKAAREVTATLPKGRIAVPVGVATPRKAKRKTG